MCASVPVAPSGSGKRRTAASIASSRERQRAPGCLGAPRAGTATPPPRTPGLPTSPHGPRAGTAEVRRPGGGLARPFRWLPRLRRGGVRVEFESCLGYRAAPPAGCERRLSALCGGMQALQGGSRNLKTHDRLIQSLGRAVEFKTRPQGHPRLRMSCAFSAREHTISSNGGEILTSL